MKLIIFVLAVLLTGCLPPATVQSVNTPGGWLISGGTAIVICVYLMRTQDRDDWLTTWLFWLGVAGIMVGGILQ